MWWTTARGPGTGPDSVVYLETAESLIRGSGLQHTGRPLTHFPPGYPALLALALTVCPDKLAAARVLAALLYAATGILAGAVVFSAIRSVLASSLASVSVFLSEPVVATYSMVRSEPLFIALSLTALLFLTRFVERGHRLALAGTCAAIGCACLVRYVGVTLIPPTLGVLLLTRGHTQLSLRQIALTIPLMLLPLSAWLTRNVFAADSLANRAPAFHPITSRELWDTVDVLHHFVLPVSMPSALKALLVGGIAVAFVAGVLRVTRHQPSTRCDSSFVAPMFAVLFGATYLVFLAISLSYFDANTHVTSRILLPVLIVMSVGALCLAWRAAQSWDRRALWFGFVATAAFSTMLNTVRAVPVAARMHRESRGYTAWQWSDPRTLTVLGKVHSDSVIYSNGADLLRFVTGRAVQELPAHTDPGSRRRVPEHEGRMAAIAAECGSGKAIVIYLTGVSWRSHVPTAEELAALGIPVQLKTDDGWIFGR